MHLTQNKYTRSQYLLAFILVVVFSCQDSPKDKSIPYMTQGERTVIKPGSSFSDTLTLDHPAAVFFCPDSLQLEKMKKATDPNDFDGNMHEYEYLIKNAQSVIKKILPRLNIVKAINVKYLLFIRADNTKEFIDLDKESEPCGLFVFNRVKPPELLDMSNIETGLEFYFFR